MKKALINLLKISGVILLLLAVLFGLLQTVRGKAVLASFLSKSLSRSGNLSVHVGVIHGWVPVNMHIESLDIGDAEGTWLSVSNLQSRWIIGDMLHGVLHMEELGAGQVEMFRFPKVASSSPPRSDGRKWIEELDVVLEGWSVDRLKLGEDVAGTPLEYAVSSGGILLQKGRLEGDLLVSGDAVGQVNLKASFGRSVSRHLDLHAELQRLVQPSFGLDHLSGILDAEIDDEGMNATVAARMAEGDKEGELLATLRYNAGTLQIGNVRFSGLGWSAQGVLDLAFAPSMIGLDVDLALADPSHRAYSLTGKTEILTGNPSWSVNIPSMALEAWHAATVTLSGRFNPEAMDLKAELAAFDLSSLPFPAAAYITGEAGGSLTLTGAPGAPRVHTDLEVTRFNSASKTLNELPGLDFRIVGELAEGWLRAETSVTNFPSGYLRARASSPVTFSLIPFNLEITPDQLQGSLDARLDLDVFNGLALLEDQAISGILTADLNIEDSVPSGYVLFEKGAYEHYNLGLLFRDLNARFDARPEGLVISKAGGTDGKDGRFGLSGHVSSTGPDLALTITRASIVRRPEIEATISGSLGLSGTFVHPEIAGRLVVDRANLLPDNLVSARPRLLEDYDADAGEEEAVDLGRRTQPRIGMDVRIDMPDQLYVNASLIDSVWGGWIELQDDEGGLTVKGKIEPRRGFVDFIGKKFRLVDGSVDMDSTVNTLPVMNNLTAEYSRSDISARLILNGRVDHPQYLLESTPAMPEDEILSQILFRRDANNISAYQAIQIASAARQLSNGISGPGFMYQFRQAVGFDALEWREPDTADGKSSVAAGKYITPELYVEVSSTVGSEAQTDMSAEYEINRHFSVETSMGPKLRPGIGVNWKNDY